uniref:Uncharacterized protein n=1 Tax=Caulerpa lentillifera TaxID=148947 RepID=A0A2Z2QKP3_9CHLO|nr:hypothetical protein [Caulerpa lentillifera]AST24249.1 hypothetical protein [Caulerpa lentillifera]
MARSVVYLTVMRGTSVEGSMFPAALQGPPPIGHVLLRLFAYIPAPEHSPTLWAGSWPLPFLAQAPAPQGGVVKANCGPIPSSSQPHFVGQQLEPLKRISYAM